MLNEEFEQCGQVSNEKLLQMWGFNKCKVETADQGCSANDGGFGWIHPGNSTPGGS